jgi:hypothetical protein
VQLFGGLDEFIEQTDFFREQFLTDAEQIAPIQASVIAELQRLGVAGVTTRDQFKAVGARGSTSPPMRAGRCTPRCSRSRRRSTRCSTTSTSRQQEGDPTRCSRRSTSSPASPTASEVPRHAVPDRRGAGQRLQLAEGAFIATADLAATGDATALGGLETAGKDFLTSAKEQRLDAPGYYRDVALVARGVDKGIFAATETADYAQLQLEALQNAASILQSISDNTAATAAALAADVAAAQQAAAGTPVPQASVSEAAAAGRAGVPGQHDQCGRSGDGQRQRAQERSRRAQVRDRGLRDDLNAALQAIAGNTGATARQLKRWDDGDALKVTADDDDPLPVNLTELGR